MSLEDTPPKKNGKKHYTYKINGVDYPTTDAVQDGRSLLRKGGFDPASDHILIKLTRPGSGSIGLDEEVDLSDPGQEEFRAFLSDRSFTFTVDERGYEWGAPTISEQDLRYIVGLATDKVLILEHEGEKDEVIDEGTYVDLAARGTEHIRTGKRLVTVYYRDNPFELKRGIYSGAQLSEIFNVPDKYQLDLVKPNGEFDEIGAAEPVPIKEGMHFVSHPPSGQSS